MLPPDVPRDLGDGLLLRSANSGDAEALAEFNAMVHGGPPEIPDVQAAIWTRDLLRGDHPTSHVEDFTVVEERATGRIVSSCLLISQTWTYGGIPFGVGRPEMVGTHPGFRGRGLIGRQFEVIHRRSAERGHLVQALTGIPNFYRRVGYEPALIIPPPANSYPTLIDDLPPSEKDGIQVRPAIENDVPFFTALYAKSNRTSLIATRRDETIWRYELLDRNPGSDYVHNLAIVESVDGDPIGAIGYFCSQYRGALTTVVTLVEFADDALWPLVVQPVMRYFRNAGDALASAQNVPHRDLSFGLLPDHPLLQLGRSLFPNRGRPFSWDVRVPDLLAFLRLIKPELERRLAASVLAGYTGTLGITFYRSALRLVFQDGRLAVIEPWLPEPVWQADAAFPGNTFLYLLFGSRSLTDLSWVFPDCRFHGDIPRVLLETLFPVRPSSVWPIG